MPKDPLKAFEKRIWGAPDGENKPVLAATVILLRDGTEGLETLMLRKNSKIVFGGMWVFPGGRIDVNDGAPDASAEEKARHAAVREAKEEAALVLDPTKLLWFSHWTPPAMGNKRFITWFFAAQAPDETVTIDDGEITASQWLRPGEALTKQKEGEIEVVPPTYVTLHYLSQYPDVRATGQNPLYHYLRYGQDEGRKPRP